MVICLEGMLKAQLGCAVWIDRQSHRLLGDGQSLRHAIGGASGGENQLSHGGVDHCIEQRKPSYDVVLKIFRGLATDSPTKAWAAKCMTACTRSSTLLSLWNRRYRR